MKATAPAVPRASTRATSAVMAGPGEAAATKSAPAKTIRAVRSWMSLGRAAPISRVPGPGDSDSSTRPSAASGATRIRRVTVSILRSRPAAIAAKRRGSVPVTKVWQPSAASRSNSAARRLGSRCAATSSRSRIGVMPLMPATSSACARMSPISSAFCSPVEESAAGMSFSAKTMSRSLRCGPSSVRPAARSAARPALEHAARYQSSASAALRPAIALSKSPASASRPAGKADARRCRRRCGRPKQRRRLGAGERHRDGVLGKLRLDRIEPGRSGVFLQQPVPLREQPFEVACAAAMRGIDGQHQAVEEAPALGRRAGEQAVHRRRQPQDAEIFEQRLGRGDRRAVDAHLRVFSSPERRLGEARADARLLAVPRKVAATAQPADVPRARRSPRSSRGAGRDPASSSEIASSRLVLPAPFSPVSTTNCARSRDWRSHSCGGS